MNAKQKKGMPNKRKSNCERCCKKTLKEIKEAINSIVGKNRYYIIALM